MKRRVASRSGDCRDEGALGSGESEGRLSSQGSPGASGVDYCPLWGHDDSAVR